MQEAALNNLFCMNGPVSASGRGRACEEGLRTGFREMLARLNFASTCYLTGPGGLDQGPFFLALLDDISTFLTRYPFLQLSLRPVHPFSPGEQEGWMEIYEKFLLACRPFQQEGYRQQIVSRLRIFPVITFNGIDALEPSRTFLEYLKKNFFLPSILLSGEHAAEMDKRMRFGSGHPWERIFFSEGGAGSPWAILETLADHALADTLLDRNRARFLGDGPLCAESRALEPGGNVRQCLLAGACDGAGGDLPEGTAEPDPLSCIACVHRMLDRTEESFRVNGRSGSWHEMCERFASSLQELGNREDAVRAWDRCFRGLPPENIPLHQRLQKALCSYEAGKLEPAMEELSEAGRLYPESPEVRFYMGLCEFGWRDYIEAADRFQEAVTLGLENPMKEEAEYLRGESHVHLEEYDDAMEALERAEREGRSDSPLYFYQGLCLLGTERPGEAVRSLKKALDLGPSQDDLFHVLFYIANALKESEEFAEAVSYCVRAEPLGAESQELYNLKGFCHFKLKEHDEAIRCFERCIEIDPRSAIDYANIGSNLRDKGDLEGAVAMYKKALAMDPAIDFARDSLQRIEKGRKGNGNA